VTGWVIFTSILFIALGIFAIVEPFTASLVITIFLAWLLIFGGIFHLIEAFTASSGKQLIWRLLIGIVFLIGGIYFRRQPFLAIGTLTLVLAFIILAEGVLELITFFDYHGEGSGVILLNAIVTLILGGLILFHWPSSSIWAIGILVGVDLLVTGITRLVPSLAARRLLRRVTP
jgi:uncharacterized membrane protein HdeD (DUF308 family)